MKKMKRYWLLACLLVAPWLLQAQPILTVNAGNVSGCAGDTISIPVTVTGSAGVSAISLALNYQTQTLQYAGLSNVLPALSGNLIANATGGKVLVSWFSTQVSTLSTSTLFHIRMVVQGNSPLDWDVATPGNCEIADANGTPINTAFVNGFASLAGANIVLQPFGQSQIAAGSSTQFEVSATGATSYQWQRLQNGQWVPLQNDAVFQGEQSPVLRIINASAALNNSEYRVLIMGSCPSPVFSNSITLFVTSSQPAGVNLPITWDDPAVSYSFTDFGGNASMFAPSPTQAGNTTLRTEKTVGAQTWAGTTITPTTGLAAPIPFSTGATSITVQVFAPAAGITVRLKAEQAGVPTISVETDAVTTTAGWQNMVFNFANQATGTAPINFASTYNMLSIFYGFGNAGNGAVFFADSVFFNGGPVGPPPVAFNLPITWDNPALSYSVTDFGGNVSMLAPSPTQAGNTTLRTEKTIGAQIWAGTTLTPPAGLASPIPFTSMATTISVQVHAPAAGLVVRLKAEQVGAPSISVETDANTTNVGWQTLVFNFANQVTGTPSLNVGTTYNMLSIFYDFGNMGTGAVFFADSVYFGGGPVGPPPVVFNLPITWDDPSLTYVFTDFGGNSSMLAPSPTQPSNLTLRTVKTAGAETWAGTTITPLSGLSSPIPFSSGATNISVQVHAPAPGIVIRLKAEQAGVPTNSVETEATTTTAGWQTLTFNFANQAAGTAPINFGTTYNLLSIFYGFGSVGSGAVFFADSVYFGGSPVAPPPAAVQLGLPQLTACVGDTLLVPISHNGINSLGALSLAVNYPVQALEFAGFENADPALAQSLLVNAVNGQVLASWFDVNGVSLAAGNLFAVRFIVRGPGALQWDLTTAGNCELANASGQIIPTTFTNGGITTVGQSIVLQPAGQTRIPVGGSSQLVVDASNATGYQWESLVQGQWVPLVDNANFQGVQTPGLAITSATAAMNGLQLRVAVFGACPNPVISNVLTLFVFTPSPSPLIGVVSQTACLGDTVEVPISSNDLSNLGALSLSLNYPPQQLEFVGISQVNAALMSSLIVNAANGQVRASWFDVNGVSIFAGNLFSLRFVVSAPANLIWDLATPGNCELADVNGQILPATFNNGSVAIGGQSIVDQPFGNTNLVEGDSTILVVDASGATGYQWQIQNGQLWEDIQNNNLYAGAQTAMLQLNGVPFSLNGKAFRVLVFGSCAQPLVSNIIRITVQPGVAPPYNVSLQASQACLGDTSMLQIKVDKFQQIGAVSMVLEHDQAFGFGGIRSVHPAVNTANLVVTPQQGRVAIAWFNSQPLNLPDGATFMTLRFAVNGSGAFAWDTLTPGNCEIANSNGDVLVGSFNGLSLQPNPAPAIAMQPGNQLVAQGDTALFSVSVTNVQTFQWQRLVAGSWADLSNDAVFSGTQTSQLRVVASLALSGAQFRARLTGACAFPSITQSASLTVAASNQVVGIGAPQLTACLNQTVSLPIQVSQFNGVGAFSLSLQYDTTLLQYAGFTANAAIQNGVVVNGNFGNTVRISWFNVQPVNLGNATLINLQFTTRALGQSGLSWTSGIQGVNEIADANGQVMLSNFNPGVVLINGTSPLITQQPQALSVPEGSNAVFTVTATNASQYQWQTLSGTQWVNLQNQGAFSGVNTASLQISATTLTQNGTQYRVQVTGNCQPSITSQPVQLTVTPNVSTIVFSLRADTLCAGGLVSVPVRVSQFNQIGTFSLRVLYNQSNLQFTGLTNVHSALQATLASGAANGRVSLSWFGLQPVSLGDTVLFNLNFRANGSSSLVWDTVSAGVGTVTNTQGIALPRNFVNGQIVARPLPVVTFPAYSNVCLNAAIVPLQAFPGGGQFSGPGVSGAQFNPATAGLGTHVLTYSYTDPTTGCSNSATQTITVLPLPIGSAGADQTICLGSTASLLATGGSSYLWSTGATTATINVSPLVTTSYTVRIFNNSGCSIVDTVVVNIFNDPSLSAGNDTAICLGGSVQLQASGALQYFWTPATGLSANNVANPIASPSQTTEYIVAGLTSSGCVSLDTILVTVNPRPQANAGADQVVCNGLPAQLQASGGLSYSWSPAAGLSATNIANPTANPAQTTDYIVTVTNASGCSSTDTVRVFVPVVLAGSNQNICRGGSAQLQANLIGAPAGAVSYSWSPATGLSATNIANPLASPATTTVYTVTATINGCAVSNTVAVIVNPTPTIDAGLNVAIAPGGSIQLAAIANGGITPYAIQWSPATGLSNSQLLNPIASPASTTMYYLTVTGANGCSVTDSVLVTIDPNLLGKNIFGKLVYANSMLSALSPGTVQLRDSAGALLSTVNVDGSGNYLFQNNNDATYLLNGTTSRAWGGVTSADALLINEYFANPAIITTGPLGEKAADVNNDGAVTSLDALLTLQRAINTINSFAAGDWVYATDTVQLAGAHLQRNVRAMCVGDVNASYDPNLRIRPRVLLAEGSRMGRPAFGTELVQLLVEDALAIGSFQLELQLQAGDKLVSVHQPGSSMQPIFAQQGDVVRIGWFTTAAARELQAGDLFLQLQISTQGFGAKGLPFEIIGLSEMTDKAAVVHPQVQLRSPVWSPSFTQLDLKLSTYPNPARDVAKVVFSIPQAGQVRLVLTDMTGKTIDVPMNQYQREGQYELSLEAASLASGMYFIRLEHEADGRVQRLQERLIIQK